MVLNPPKIVREKSGILYIRVAKGEIVTINSFNKYILNKYPEWFLQNGYILLKRDLPSKYGKAKESVSLSRLILRLEHKDRYLIYVDHIDRNPLNNVISNLRPCLPKQNARNKSMNKTNTSGYKGVSKLRRKNTNLIYRSYIVDGKQIHLGQHKTAKQAAMAYDKAAKRIFGEFAVLNFPD